MKKSTLLIGILLLLTLLIAACGSTSQANDSAEANVAVAAGEIDATQAPIGDGIQQRLAEGEIPLAMELSLGTLMLEETSYPIDAEQAAELLPLWKALRSLSESETVASEEIEAVLNQIQDTLTPEQITAIESMELTIQDLGAIADEMGLELGGGFGGRFGEMTPEQQATMEAARASGEFPRGGPGGGQGLMGGGAGGGMGPGGGEISPEARETAIAERGGTRGANLGVNPFILEAIIEFLESKI